MTWGLVYFGLAIAATRISWSASISFVGVFLAVASATTAIGHYVLPFPYRVILETCLAMTIALATVQSWDDRTDRLCRAILCLVALDFIVCAAFCWLGLAGVPSRHAFAIVTNAVFALQCFCVGAPGGRNIVRNGVRRLYVWRFMDRPQTRRDTIADKRADR